MGHDYTVLNGNEMMTVATCHIKLMQNHDDGAFGFAVEGVKEIQHLNLVSQIQIGGRFI